jgi:hypothetical protein
MCDMRAFADHLSALMLGSLTFLRLQSRFGGARTAAAYCF